MRNKKKRRHYFSGIRRFRFLRVSFFTLRIIFLYLFVALIGKFIPQFLYAKLLRHVNKRVSKRLRNYFFKLQGIYIKVGQFLSVIANIFAPDMVKYLKELQDRVPPRPFDVMESVFKKEWGVMPWEVLQEFEREPIASASLGQVYVGVYKEQKVAVKVLYPHIKEIIEKDLQILKSVLSMINFFFPGLDTGNLYNEFADMIIKEIDFSYEKSNISRIRKILSDEETVFIPEYIRLLSKGDILVTQFVEGSKIDDLKAIEEQLFDGKEIATKLLNVYSKMIFEHGFFHSDPHPGNLILTPNGRIGIIDFGSVDTLPDEIIIGIRKLLKAFLFKDISLLVQQLEDMGFLRPSADKEQIENIVYFILQKLMAFEIKDYQRMTLNEIYKVYNIKVIGVKFQQLIKELQIPRHYLFLGRTIGILVGVVGKLYPGLNIIQVLLPHLKKFLLDRKENLSKVIKQEVKEKFHYFSQMPENIHKALETLNSGRIKINLKEFKKDIRKLYILGHQFIYTLLLIMLGSFSLIFHLHKLPVYSKISAIGAGVFGFFLLVSFMRNRRE